MTRHTCSWEAWRKALDRGAFRDEFARLHGAVEAPLWERRYARALDAYAESYGRASRVAVARCPAQMNLMGMHLDYGGMPSLRMAVRGSKRERASISSSKSSIRIDSRSDSAG